jgi:hypothetical protein
MIVHLPSHHLSGLACLAVALAGAFLEATKTSPCWEDGEPVTYSAPGATSPSCAYVSSVEVGTDGSARAWLIDRSDRTKRFMVHVEQLVHGCTPQAPVWH